MSPRHYLLVMISASILPLIGVRARAEPPDTQPAASTRPAAAGGSEKLALSGPHTHENLTIYLVHGQDKLPGRDFLTLEEALEQKKAKVHETENVSELAIENLTEDEDIFIQAGDIVCGGKQDRILSQDLVVSPKSGRIPLQSFCVEAGRWQGRGSEPTAYFSSSGNTASSNALKLAIRKERDQQKVWQQVAETQKKLSHNVGEPVQSPDSLSSLELTLKHEELGRKTEPYREALSATIQDSTDVVGVVMVLNRKLYSADVYGSPRLFEKLWPKLLDAGAVEAVAQLNERHALHMPTHEAIQAFLATPAEPSRSTDVLTRYRLIEKETPDKMVFELEDKGLPGLAIHASVVPNGR